MYRKVLNASVPSHYKKPKTAKTPKLPRKETKVIKCYVIPREPKQLNHGLSRGQ